MIKNAWAFLAAAAFATGCATQQETPKPAPQPAPKPAPAPAPKPAPVPQQEVKPAPKPEAAKPQPVAEKITFAADVLFDFDKAVIKPEGRSKLDDLANKIKGVNLEVVIAIGHADRIASDAYNQRLSVRRAESVKAYLVSKAVESNRVYTEGKGKKQPVTGNRCRNMGPENRRNKKLIDCLAPDRRVEIEVIGTRRP